jgi:hypothetical protein
MQMDSAMALRVETTASPGADRNRVARTRTYFKGKVVYGAGAFTVDCLIRDMSEGGAKIIIEKHMALPAEFYLIAVKQGVAYKAKVVWQKFPGRGVQFSEAYKLDGALPPAVQFLHRLWVDLQLRGGTL